MLKHVWGKTQASGRPSTWLPPECFEQKPHTRHLINYDVKIDTCRDNTSTELLEFENIQRAKKHKNQLTVTWTTRRTRIRKWPNQSIVNTVTCKPPGDATERQIIIQTSEIPSKDREQENLPTQHIVARTDLNQLADNDFNDSHLNG